MTNPNFGLLDPNAFGRGYETSNNIVGGITKSFQEGEKQNALRAYAANPNAPDAINSLAQYDPRLAITAQQHQAETRAKKEERDTKIIAALARDAKDPASFDAAVDQVVAMGYPDAVQFKGKFSPELRSALMAAGGISENDAQPTAMERNYQFLNSRNPQLGESYLKNQANPPRFVPDGAGGFIAIDTAAIGGPAPGKGAGPPQVLTDDEWEGGQSQPATGGFLDPLSPR